MAFYDTFATYIGDGTTTDYPIPFPRIEDDHISVRVDDVVTAYTLVSTSMLRISPAPEDGAIIRVQRETDVSQIEATFQNGSPIPATQINLDFRQLLYAAQEASDLRTLWFRTNGPPDPDLGKQGDWAIDESTGDLYQKISDLEWQSNISIIGPSGTTWYSGSGAPSGGLGKVTDWYLNDVNGDVYEKTAISTWTLRDNLTGPQGPQGNTGVGVPTGGTTGQYLVKVSNSDYAFAWQTPTDAGDVDGPGSATDNAIARFDGTTGKLIQNSGVTIDDNGKTLFPASTSGSATLNIADGAAPSSPVSGDIWMTASSDLNVRRGSSNQRFALMDQINAWGQGAQQQFRQSASFAGIRITPSNLGEPGSVGNGDLWYDSNTNKLFARINGVNVDLSAAGAAPSWASITGKPTTISGYAISDAYTVTQVDTLLAGKANTTHSHAISDVTGLSSTLSGKSDTTHNHTLDSLSNVTVTSKATGDILRWNGSAWVNVASGTTWQPYQVEDLVSNTTGSTFDFALTDLGKMVVHSNGSATNARIRLEANIAWPAGARIDIVQAGTGQVTITAEGGVTLRSRGSRFKTNAQYAVLCLVKIGTNEWLVTGDAVA